jgi:restriction system protein
MIPDYQTLMLPILKTASDGREHRIGNIIEPIGRDFGLTETEMAELLPSGRQTILSNRVHWAKTYLVQAKLLEVTKRGHFKITDRGRKVLATNPVRVDKRLLDQFPDFNEFLERTRDGAVASKSANNNDSTETTSDKLLTPDEVLRTTIAQMDEALSLDLLHRIRIAPPVFFEELIVTLLLTMGYGGSREGAGRAIGKTGDDGIDGVIDQDPLGLDRVYLQAKRYKADNAIGAPHIQGFSGSLGVHKASKGVFVTTSYFTKQAYEFAEKHPLKMVLIDGKELAALMLRHNVGVRSVETLFIKKIDEDFFSDE